MNIKEIIAKELNIPLANVQAVMDLLDEGNTIPFIARYRKETTGSLNDEQLRLFYERLIYLNNLEEREKAVIKSIEDQGKMTDELFNKISQCQTLSELEDFYRPYKPHKKTRASIAKERGLTPLADFILKQESFDNLLMYAKSFIDKEKGLTSIDLCINGGKDIIAEQISDEAKYRKFIKDFIKNTGYIVSKEINASETGIFDMYKDYQEKISAIAPHRILAINRGEVQKNLKVGLSYDFSYLQTYLSSQIINNKQFGSIFNEIIEDSLKRLILPSIETEIRNDLFEYASNSSIQLFKENLRQVLLVPPMKNKVVLGLDPGYAHGCKIAVVDMFGKVLDTTVTYFTPPRSLIEQSKKIIEQLIIKYGVDIIAIGNGTASRESEQFISELIKGIHTNKPLDYAIVNEAGASIYSASALATKEFPNYDTNLRSAVSIARRLQDPLAELVKIAPESIGVGQYQHDMNQKRLSEVLTGVVEDTVNQVGVDLNLASPSLLSYISGITSGVAENIVKYREENAGFRNRKELLKVNKLGPKCFEQCAGFLRISGNNPLDNTGVHPESYEKTMELLDNLHIDLHDLNSKETNDILEKIDIQLVAKQLKIGEFTLKDIVEELKKPGRDPREVVDGPALRNDVKCIEDLKEGMICNGTVRNIMDFGVFVDIGVHQDGLVHISEISNQFVKHPMDVLKVNQIVKVKVIKLDISKKRISLSIKQAES